MEKKYLEDSKRQAFEKSFANVGFLENTIINGIYTIGENKEYLSNKLEEWSLVDGHIFNSEFSEVVLKKCYIKNISFHDVNFIKVIFEDCVFENCSFLQCNFERSNFRGSLKFSHCNISKTKFNDISFRLTSFQFCNDKDSIITGEEVDIFNGHNSEMNIESSYFPFATYREINTIMNKLYKIVYNLKICTCSQIQYKF